MKTSNGFTQTQRLLMLGLGVTGRAVCDYAHRHAIHVSVSEQSDLTSDQRAWLELRGIAYEQGGHTSKLLSDTDLVILSPAIPVSHALVQEACQRGLLVLSEIEYALGLLPDRRVIAVTGTNGKSSTVEVIGRLLKSQGQRAWVAGNIGVPLIELVDDVDRRDVLVLEISSYQLEQSLRLRPGIGVLLNLTPDHMKRHKDMQSYAQAKKKLFAHQELCDVAILPTCLASQFDAGKGRRVFYDTLDDPFPDFSRWLYPHERSNLKAATAACEALLPGFDRSLVCLEDILEALRLPHRMEPVGTVHGVHVINDSKSTNAASTIAALHSVQAPTVLLLGGRFKGAGYDVLAAELSVSNVREVILFGEAADALRHVLEANASVDLQTSSVASLWEALDRAMHIAVAGDVVLFSPACSSFDAFSDYAQRGVRFMEHVRSMPGFEQDSTRT